MSNLASRAELARLNSYLERDKRDRLELNFDPPAHFRGAAREIEQRQRLMIEQRRDRLVERLHEADRGFEQGYDRAVHQDRSGGPDHRRDDGPEFEREPG